MQTNKAKYECFVRIELNLIWFSDSAEISNKFKCLISKSSQYSQLRTKYYGLVEGMLKNFKNFVQDQRKSSRYSTFEEVDITEEMADLYRKKRKRQKFIETCKIVAEILVTKLHKVINKIEIQSSIESFSKRFPSQNLNNKATKKIFQTKEAGSFFRAKTVKNIKQLIHKEKSSPNKYQKKFFDIMVIPHPIYK
jgi:hypothetical protein